MTALRPLAAAALVALGLAACTKAPAAPGLEPDPIPPPRRPYDAKTQLEYGNPPPPPPPRY